jgi:hypothetical protein
MRRDPSTIRAFLAQYRELYARAAQALAQGQLPVYSQQEEQEVLAAYAFVANMAGGDGNVFSLHLQEPIFTNWRTCMNKALAGASSNRLTLEVLSGRDLGPGRIALVLWGGAEPLRLALGAGPQPFQLLPAKEAGTAATHTLETGA